MLARPTGASAASAALTTTTHIRTRATHGRQSPRRKPTHAAKANTARAWADRIKMVLWRRMRIIMLMKMMNYWATSTQISSLWYDIS